MVAVPFEKLWPRHRQRLRRPELTTDLLYAMLAPITQVVGAIAAVAIGLVSLAWVPALPLRPIVGSLPSPVRGVIAIVLFDFLVYASHRASHEVPFLWRFHSVHHSTKTLDWVSGFRAHPFDGVFAAPAFAVLLGAGFSLRIAGSARGGAGRARHHGSPQRELAATPAPEAGLLEGAWPASSR